MSTNRFENEELKFDEIPCKSNTSYVCLGELKNAKNGFSLDEYLWRKGAINRILLFVNSPCGTCQIASRLILELKLFLANRISSILLSRISFVVIDVGTVHLPVSISFDSFPQILMFPASSDTSGDSLMFDKQLTLMNLVSWLIRTEFELFS